MLLLTYLDTIYCRDRFLRPNSLVSYRHTCRQFGRDVNELNQETIGDYARRLIEKGNRPDTVKARVNVLCVLWRHAHARGMASDFRSPSKPKCPRKIIRATPRDEITRLVRYCQTLPGVTKRSHVPRSTYWSAFVACSYETALRTSDLRQLRWVESGRWHLVQVKTGRPVTVDVGPSTLSLVADLSRVSPSLFDLGWRREWYCRGIARIAATIGIAITPQQLRQSAASEAERLRPGTAWILLGHTSPETTRRWYIDEQHSYRDLPRPRLD